MEMINELPDAALLPHHFDSRDAEATLGAFWEKERTYAWSEQRETGDLFSIDTPPPTVSGRLHIGHCFSFTQTDIIARYMRMNGRRVFYPMGWDDNGLPTERRVENYFNVRCSLDAPDDAALTPAALFGDASQRPPVQVSRAFFIKLCSLVTREDESAFRELWRRIGLSVDWGLEYTTVGAAARRLAQQSFIDLYRDGEVYSAYGPMMWDIDFKTAVAQAELEDREQTSAYHFLRFLARNGDVVIATTRPELLPACVAVAVNPADPINNRLIGERLRTPLFDVEVPVFASPEVDPEKGTGIVMVCTFGDTQDVAWWRRERLPLRQILGRDGKILQLDLGTAPANEQLAELAGLSIPAARARIVEMLSRMDARGSGIARPPQPIVHRVNYYEKGRSPVEILSTRQWFVKLLDKREALLRAGESISWVPEHMGLRYADWTRNLSLDWCISRQRYFGVPFPVWYSLDERGEPDHEHPILADTGRLPVDPLQEAAPGYREEQRGRPLGFVAERDVFDTWFTSSLTPQLSSELIGDPSLLPMTVRPQAHEIIRTWAFYSVVKAMLHNKTLPWRTALISGWILDAERKKMSKSKGNTETPADYVDAYGADGVRYWAASARLGADTALDPQVMKDGRRLATKLYNAGKFALSSTPATLASSRLDGRTTTNELDRCFIAELRAVVVDASTAFESYRYELALSLIERFFWQSFTDSFLELAKRRVRESDASVLTTLHLALNVLLRLFAPFLPYVTDTVWGWLYGPEKSVHRAPWPSLEELSLVAAPNHSRSFLVARGALAAIHSAKTQGGRSVGASVDSATLTCPADDVVILRGDGTLLLDIAAAARIGKLELALGDDYVLEMRT